MRFALPGRSTVLGNVHAPLILALHTFYNLLANMDTIESRAIITPSAATGRHDASRIDVAAAHAYGFGDQALEVLFRIPYLDDSAKDVLLDYETQPLSYLNGESGDSESSFAWAQDPTCQDRTDVIPAHVVVLTQTREDGVTLLYDATNFRITAWNWESDSWTDESSYDMMDINNPLYKWIIEYLELKRFHLSEENLFLPNLSYGPHATANFLHDQSLRNVFISAGWNPNAASEIINKQNHESNPIWETLELARLAASAGFDKEDFQRRKAVWTAERPLSDRTTWANLDIPLSAKL